MRIDADDDDADVAGRGAETGILRGCATRRVQLRQPIGDNRRNQNF